MLLLIIETRALTKIKMRQYFFKIGGLNPAGAAEFHSQAGRPRGNTKL